MQKNFKVKIICMNNKINNGNLFTAVLQFENSIDTNMNVYTLSLRYSLLS